MSDDFRDAWQAAIEEIKQLKADIAALKHNCEHYRNARNELADEIERLLRQDGKPENVLRVWNEARALTPREQWYLAEMVANNVGYELVAREVRRCAECGAETNGEEAYIDGEYWCHPCADGRVAT